MHVRELQSDDDIWAVRDLAIAHHKEFGDGRDFQTSAVVQSGIECREQPTRYMNCWIAYTNDGKPVGYLAASTCRQYHSHKRIAMQDMWFVLPEHRGARCAVMLLDAYELWAQGLGCETMFTLVEHNEFTELTAKTAKLMSKLGFAKRGSVHAKVLGE